jgi:hypothetical protein
MKNAALYTAKRIEPLSACAALAKLTPAAAMAAATVVRNPAEILMIRTPQIAACSACDASAAYQT